MVNSIWEKSHLVGLYDEDYDKDMMMDLWDNLQTYAGFLNDYIEELYDQSEMSVKDDPCLEGLAKYLSMFLDYGDMEYESRESYIKEEKDSSDECSVTANDIEDSDREMFIGVHKKKTSLKDDEENVQILWERYKKKSAEYGENEAWEEYFQYLKADNKLQERKRNDQEIAEMLQEYQDLWE